MKVFISYTRNSRRLAEAFYTILKQSNIPVSTSVFDYYDYTITIESLLNKIRSSDIIFLFGHKIQVRHLNIVRDLIERSNNGINIVYVVESDELLDENQLYYYPKLIINNNNPLSTIDQIRNYYHNIETRDNRNEIIGLILLATSISFLELGKNNRGGDYFGN